MYQRLITTDIYRPFVAICCLEVTMSPLLLLEEFLRIFIEFCIKK